MTMLVYVFDFLCTINESYWLYRWADYVYEKRTFVLNNRTLHTFLFPCLIAVYLGMTISLNHITLTSPYTVTILLVVALASVVLFWKCDILQAIIVVGLYFFLLFAKGNIEISAVGFIGGQDLVQQACFDAGMPRTIMILASMVILYIINYEAIKLTKKRHFKEHLSQNMAVMTIFGLAGSFLFGKVFIDSFRLETGILWYMFMAITLMLLYMMYYTMRSQQIHFRIHTLELQNTILEKYYVQVDDAYKRKSKMYHEMNHHLQTIYHFLESGESKKAAEYIEAIGCIGDGQKKEIFTGIDLIDAIFNDFLSIASVKGIKINIKAQVLPLNIGFSNSDMCSLFSNLLENAMDAADTFIKVQLNHAGRSLYLKVENDCIHKPVRKENHFVTMKKDAHLHGWGTQIVEDIVRKYEGDYEYNCKENLFSVSIMISEKSEE